MTGGRADRRNPWCASIPPGMVRSLRKRWRGSRRCDDRAVRTTSSGTGSRITRGMDRPERAGEHAAPVGSTAGTVVERPKRPGCFRAIRNRHGSTWGIKMKDHSTSRIASRVKDILRLCREFISRSTGFHASNGRRAVPVDRPARFIRLVEPYARLSCSVSPIPVRTDSGGPPCFRAGSSATDF